MSKKEPKRTHEERMELFEESKWIVPYQIYAINNVGYVAKTRLLEVEDLLQVGYIALWNATAVFDDTRCTTFTYYAKKAITYNVFRYLKQYGSLIYLPAGRKQEERADIKFVSSSERVKQENDLEVSIVDMLPANDSEQHFDELERELDGELLKDNFDSYCKEPATAKQKEFVFLLLEGHNENEIAAKLGCSRQAINVRKKKVQAILQKEKLYQYS